MPKGADSVVDLQGSQTGRISYSKLRTLAHTHTWTNITYFAPTSLGVLSSAQGFVVLIILLVIYSLHACLQRNSIQHILL